MKVRRNALIGLIAFFILVRLFVIAGSNGGGKYLERAILAAPGECTINEGRSRNLWVAQYLTAPEIVIPCP